MKKTYYILLLLFIMACKPIEIVTFKGDKRQIEFGDEITLKWEVKNATDIQIVEIKDAKYSPDKKSKVINVIHDNLEPTGTATIKPDSTISKYKLIAKRKGKIEDKSFSFNAVEPIINHFKIDTSNRVKFEVTVPGEVELWWKTTDAQKVRFEGLEKELGDSLPLAGKMKVSIDSTKKIRLVAHGKYKNTYSSYRNIERRFPDAFSGNDIYRGESSTLTWNVKKTKGVKIEGYNRIFKAIDTLMVTPDQSTEYRLKAIRNYTNDSIILTTGIRVYSPKVTEFKMQPKEIYSGKSTKIIWNVLGTNNIQIKSRKLLNKSNSKNNLIDYHVAKGGVGLTLEQGVGTVPKKGEASVTPDESTTYYIYIKDGNKTVVDTTFVLVVPDPSKIK